MENKVPHTHLNFNKYVGKQVLTQFDKTHFQLRKLNCRCWKSLEIHAMELQGLNQALIYIENVFLLNKARVTGKIQQTKPQTAVFFQHIRCQDMRALA